MAAFAISTNVYNEIMLTSLQEIESENVHTLPRSFLIVIILLGIVLAACEPMLMYRPTAVAVIVTPLPTTTSTATATSTATPTATATATATPTSTATAFPCEENAGQVLPISDNRSDIARENMRYNVYTPPCYLSSGRRFPVVYLLHGLSYREQQWEELGLITSLNQGIRLGVLPPMVVVMPFLGNIGSENRFPPDPSYEIYLLEELMPKVERSFCTWNTRSKRAIGGISRGGFWAYSIAMRHPDLFGSVGGHSAYFPAAGDGIPASFNPLELALNASLLQGADLRMYFDNGASDSAGPGQQLFSSRLTGRGITHTYVVHPVGEHDNDYWSTHISEYLTFYAQDWPRTYSDLPDCAAPSP